MTYQEFIDNIISTRGRVLDTTEKERHHILPKCLGGTNDKDNLIDLKLEEHFIAHKLLKEEHPESKALQYAFRRMSNIRRVDGDTLIETPEQYREARLAIKQKGIETHYGQELREETKRKISAANKGKRRTPEMNEANRQRVKKYYETHDSPTKGKKASEETRRKLSESHKGRDYSYMKNPTEEQIKRRVEAFKKTYWAKPEEERKEQTRKSMANRTPSRYWLGKTIPQETRDKISATLKANDFVTPYAIPIYCKETDTVYRSILKASEAIGKSPAYIRKCLKDPSRKTNYHFTKVEKGDLAS